MFQTQKRAKLEHRSRYVEYISQFTTTIEYIKSTNNTIADALSRPSEISSISETPTSIPLSLKMFAQLAKRGRDSMYGFHMKS